jgi:hypothetical protein
MIRKWHRAAAAALAGAAVIAAQFMATTPARAAAPSITIFAKSRLAPVGGDVMLVYLGGTYGNATIHGKITGAAAGEVAALYAQQWPYTKPAVRLTTKTLTASAQVYSFLVAPDLATRYSVKLFARATARTALAISKTQYVYVLAYRWITGGTSCQNDRPVCHETFHIFTLVPDSALGVEMGKTVFPYVGANLSATGAPPLPQWLYLYAYNSGVTAAREMHTFEFENTLTFRITVGNDGFSFNFETCTRDSVDADGLGLPGSHGCGSVSRVSGTVYTYLGEPANPATPDTRRSTSPVSL